MARELRPHIALAGTRVSTHENSAATGNAGKLRVPQHDEQPCVRNPPAAPVREIHRCGCHPVRLSQPHTRASAPARQPTNARAHTPGKLACTSRKRALPSSSAAGHCPAATTSSSSPPRRLIRCSRGLRHNRLRPAAAATAAASCFAMSFLLMLLLPLLLSCVCWCFRI